MLGSLLLSAVAGTPNAPSDAVEAKVTGQPVTITLDLRGFERDEMSGDLSALLFGRLPDGVTLSIQADENVPYRSSQEHAQRRGEGKDFVVDGIHCVEIVEDLGRAKLKLTRFHAYPVNADYVFDVHVSTPPSSEKHPFARADFSAIVKSLRVAGRADASTLLFPPAYYAFRDAAAENAKNQLEWVKTRCKEQSGDPFARFYLAQLYLARDKGALAEPEYAAACQLLEGNAARTDKETLVLLEGLDRLAHLRAAQKRFDEAAPYLERMLLAVPRESVRADAPHAKRYRAGALYDLAACHAQKKREPEALAHLREALELDPGLRKAAAADALFEPLRKSPEFAELVKG